MSCSCCVSSADRKPTSQVATTGARLTSDMVLWARSGLGYLTREVERDLEGMAALSGGAFLMGSEDELAYPKVW
jgi:hypothetical protein